MLARCMLSRLHNMNVKRKAAPGVLIAAILAQNRKSRQYGSAPLPTLSPPLEVVLPSFLLRDAILARYMLWPSVLRPSVTSPFYITEITPHHRPGMLVLCCQRSPQNSTGNTPRRGREMQVGWGKINDFGQITSYI